MTSGKRVVFCAVVIFAAALDLWSKSAVFASVGAPSAASHAVMIPGVLQFQTALNPGIAWSLMAGWKARWVIAGFGTVALLLIAGFFFRARSPSWRLTAGLACVAGGTIGNLHDRLVFGAVRDFVRVLFVEFPIFNVADSFVFIGAALFALDAFFVARGAEAPRSAVSSAGV